MADTGYNLSNNHQVRYFWADDLDRVLKKVRRFVKENGHLEFDHVSFESHYSDEAEAIVWSARVIYIGWSA